MTEQEYKNLAVEHYINKKSIKDLSKDYNIPERTLYYYKNKIWKHFKDELLEKPTEFDGFIYFLRNEITRNIKIGFSMDVEKRIKDLQTSNDSELKLLKYVKGTLKQEKAIHIAFSYLNLRGEWFRSSRELLTYINRVSNLS